MRKLIACRGCSGWNSYDDVSGLLLFQCCDRGVHGCTGCNTIIHKDESATSYIISRAVSAIKAFASFQLRLLVRCNLIDHLVGDTQEFHDIVIEDADTTSRDSSHRQFFLPRYAKLADDDDI